MKCSKIGKNTGGGGVFALTLLASAATVADVIYENDFATRRSEQPLRAVWSTYTYDTGGPVAYDYDHSSSFNSLSGMYPWSTSALYSQQDGWTKKNATISNRETNRGRTSVTVEDDPALVHSAVDLVQPATNQSVIALHPLRNVFTNGVIKLQFDIRQPEGYASSRLLSWLRLVPETEMQNDNTGATMYPIELGLSGDSMSGGWRKEGDADGTRTFFTLGAVSPGHWYRFYVTCDLDRMVSDFEAYDLGTSRIAMDAAPGGAPFATRSGLLFRKELDASTGGISGIGIRFAYVDTEGYYGADGFNAGRAYMYDNIKVAWKAPASSSFTECYRNDFSSSRRRTIDGSDAAGYTYALEDRDETAVFTYTDELVRDWGIGTIGDVPHLTSTFGTAATVQKPGVDGWRFSGTPGYTGPIVLTTNGANRVGLFTRNLSVLQPMCKDITNGTVRMEWDMRMPKAWNGNYGRCNLMLTSNHGYDTQTAFVNVSLVSVGFCSADGKGKDDGNGVAETATFSILNSNARYMVASYNPSWADRFAAQAWYRIQLFVDLDSTNYWFNVYDVGTSAPTAPAAFDADSATPIASSDGELPLFADAIERDGLAIGAYGFVCWNDCSSDVDYAVCIDNIRLWKDDGSDGWDLVFQNDFSTTTRTFRRKSLNLLKSSYIDRPEYGEDGWAAMPQYYSATRVVGANPALECGQDILSVVHPIGCIAKRGTLSVQYDMRVPRFWTSRMNYFWFQLGGGALASASTWETPAYRYQTHRAIRSGMQLAYNGTTPLTTTATGIRDRTAIILQDGTGAGGDGTTQVRHIDSTYVGHWIRMKLRADMGAKTWTCAAYDMGTEQPASAATADGTLLQQWENLHFNFNEPITHLHIIGGRCPSYMPWHDDSPGSVMVDNILISHNEPGLRVTIR